MAASIATAAATKRQRCFGQKAAITSTGDTIQPECTTSAAMLRSVFDVL